MKAQLRTALLLSFLALVGDGAVRAFTNGTGCAEWPGCYGSAAVSAEVPTQIALLAVRMGVVLSLCLAVIVSLRLRRLQKPLAILLLAASAQAILAWSGPAQIPVSPLAVRMLLDFAVLGWLGWLVFRLEPNAPLYSDTYTKVLRPWLFLALSLLGIQAATGALSSAHFTATTCPGLAGPCADGWLPDATLLGALRPGRVAADATAGESVRVSLARVHRLGATATVTAVLWVAVLALFNLHYMRGTAWFLAVVSALQFGLGLSLGWLPLPAWLAANHRALTGLLLLGLLRLLMQSRSRYHPLH